MLRLSRAPTPAHDVWSKHAANGHGSFHKELDDLIQAPLEGENHDIFMSERLFSVFFPIFQLAGGSKPGAPNRRWTS